MDEAEKSAVEEITRKRIDFLRDGLEMIEKAKSFMQAYNAKNEKAKVEAAKAMTEFGNAMKEKHGYWHSKDVFFLKYWGLMGKEMDTTGM